MLGKTAIAVVLLAVAAALAAPVARTDAEYLADFNTFVKTYNRTYSSPAESSFRFNVFKTNLMTAERMSADPEEDAEFGITKFMDLTPQEFAAKYLMPKTVFANRKANDIPEADLSDLPTDIPSSFDWRNKPNALTPVKDQQQCGSCWAFSATENIESVWALQGNHTITPLSVQQIVSCDKTDQGCNGGDTPTAYQYVMSAGGLEAEKSYPYTSGGGDTGICRENKNLIVADFTGFEYATKTANETAMAVYLVNKAPLSICVDASTWQFYTGGIVKKFCGRLLDHCVQLTGYNKAGSTPYWIVRNSWGATWGNSGYIYVEMGENECGIAKEATSTYIR